MAKISTANKNKVFAFKEEDDDSTIHSKDRNFKNVLKDICYYWICFNRTQCTHER